MILIQLWPKLIYAKNKMPDGMTFNDFAEIDFVLWEVRVMKDATCDDWMDQRVACDCPFFQKNFFCKHSMAIAVRLKLA